MRLLVGTAAASAPRRRLSSASTPKRSAPNPSKNANQKRGRAARLFTVRPTLTSTCRAGHQIRDVRTKGRGPSVVGWRPAEARRMAVSALHRQRYCVRRGRSAQLVAWTAVTRRGGAVRTARRYDQIRDVSRLTDARFIAMISRMGAAREVGAINSPLLTTHTFPPMKLDYDIVKPRRARRQQAVMLVHSLAS